jgi:CheY-like chemotaxis protein
MKKEPLDKILIICDTQQESYFEPLKKDWITRFITTDAEFENLQQAKEIANFKYIVVFAELLWENKTSSAFYGIDLAVRLRLELEAKQPIAVLSSLPKAYFQKLNAAKYNILNVRGTMFFQVPTQFDEVEKQLDLITPLSSATLTYLSTQLIDERYLVNILKHLRIDSCLEDVENSLKIIDQLSTTIRIYGDLREKSEEMRSAHCNQDKAGFFAKKRELISKLNDHLHNRKDNKFSSTRHKILLLDDDPNDLAWAEKALSEHFVVVSFSDAIKAKNYIEKDAALEKETNKLSAIICDWQLLKPNSKEHQDMLGFEVLEYASTKGLYALFSLTSTDDFNIREMDAKLDIEHQLFTKDFEQGDTLWKLYIPIIQQKIDKVGHQISCIPTGEHWKKPRKADTSYHQRYVEIWNSNDWATFESQISETASTMWDYYELRINNRSNDVETEGWKKAFNFEISEQKLESLLIARRIYLACWYSKNVFDEDERNKYIYQDLSGNHDAPINNITQFISRLCVKSDKLPKGILPEERAWLAKHEIYVPE